MPSEMRAIRELTPDPSNVRRHGAKNLRAIKDSLARFGQQRPILVDRRGVVVAGNGTMQAAKELGWNEIRVEVTDLEGDEARAFAIADNRTAELAEWDLELLAEQLQGLAASAGGADLVTASGWKLDELARKLGRRLGADHSEDVGPIDPTQSPTTARGDVWLLGDHRLMCGDSTSPEDMATLMGIETATLLCTDPPYFENYQGARASTIRYERDEWDMFKSPEETARFYADFARVALAHCVDRVPIYQWHSMKRIREIYIAWDTADLLLHQTLIWAKEHAGFGQSHFRWAHEPCAYGWRKGMQPERERRPPERERTVWLLGQGGEDQVMHPTQKPLAIFERPILWHTQTGEVVLEPFSGSGSQIMAAEKTGRRCFAMELSPGYVDAAVQRWEKSTGRKATLER